MCIFIYCFGKANQSTLPHISLASDLQHGTIAIRICCLHIDDQELRANRCGLLPFDLFDTSCSEACRSQPTRLQSAIPLHYTYLYIYIYYMCVLFVHICPVTYPEKRPDDLPFCRKRADLGGGQLWWISHSNQSHVLLRNDDLVIFRRVLLMVMQVMHHF